MNMIKSRKTNKNTRNSWSTYRKFHFENSLKEIVKLAKTGNKITNQEPWKAVKSDPQRAGTCIYLCNQLAKVISIIITPYLPNSATEMRKSSS